jgi:3-isopropylmalate/(R)-2-methylmalate dehydratase small subunit
MKKFHKINSEVLPLDATNITTNMIFPSEYANNTPKGAYAQHTFQELKKQDPAISKYIDKYEDSSIIIISNEGFAEGEHPEVAVFSLLESKYRVVIGKSFPKIFSGYAAKYGLLLITLASDLIDHILKESKKAPYIMHVNLERATITLPDKGKYKFQYDEFRKECLLKGHDAEYIMHHDAEIGKLP